MSKKSTKRTARIIETANRKKQAIKLAKKKKQLLDLTNERIGELRGTMITPDSLAEMNLLVMLRAFLMVKSVGSRRRK